MNPDSDQDPASTRLRQPWRQRTNLTRHFRGVQPFSHLQTAVSQVVRQCTTPTERATNASRSRKSGKQEFSSPRRRYTFVAPTFINASNDPSQAIHPVKATPDRITNTSV